MRDTLLAVINRWGSTQTREPLGTLPTAATSRGEDDGSTFRDPVRITAFQPVHTLFQLVYALLQAGFSGC